MIASGDFPFDADDVETEEAPRVGDGVIVLDASGRVEYASPNAVSTLHRLGVHANAEGLRFSELGLEESVVSTAFATAACPVTEELPRGIDITVLMRGIPLLDHGRGDRGGGAAAGHLRAAPPGPAAAVQGRRPSARSTTG